MKSEFIKKIFKVIFIPLLLFIFTLIYLFPLLHGLILLPLDLLIGNYIPWYNPGTILLKNPYMQDSIVQLFPWRHLVYESLTHGILPLWNPYQNLGLPFMANLKPMVFYPLNIFFVFGEVRAWNFLLFSQLLLAMFFSYYLARDFKLKFAPSILSSFAFGLNSYMIGLLEFGSDAHTLIWWPLIVLFVKRYLEKGQRKYLFFSGIALSLCVFAGQLQYLGYFMIFLLAFILYYGKVVRAKPAVFILLFMSIFLGIGVSAIQLIPSLELFRYSHRGMLTQTQLHEVFSNGLITPDKLFRLFSPDFFGNPVTHDMTIGYIEGSGFFGIIPLFFALFAIVFARKQKIVQFLTTAFVVSLVFSLQGLGEILYYLKIPIITSGEGDRIFTIVLFSGSLLTGFGLSEFMELKNGVKKISSLLVFLFCYIFIVSGYALYTKHTAGPLQGFLHNVSFDTAILLLFIFVSVTYIISLFWMKKSKYLEYAFLVLIIGITFFDLFRMGYRFLTFSNGKFLYPEIGVTKFIQDNQQTTLGRTFGLTEPELGTYLNIYTLETYNPLYLLRTTLLLQSMQHLSLSGLSAHDNKYFLNGSGDALKNTLDFTGVDYIVAAKDENPALKYFKSVAFEKDLQKIYSDNSYSVYKNLQVYPRFGLYYKDSVIKNDAAMLSTLANGKTDLRNNLLLEEDLPIRLEKGTGAAHLLSTTLNKEEFQVSTTKPALFYISDTFYPGWNAMVNGKSTKIYRVNYNFRAVLVPAGTNTLELHYAPMSLFIGELVSLLCFLVLLCFWIIPFKARTYRS